MKKQKEKYEIPVGEFTNITCYDLIDFSELDEFKNDSTKFDDLDALIDGDLLDETEEE